VYTKQRPAWDEVLPISSNRNLAFLRWIAACKILSRGKELDERVAKGTLQPGLPSFARNILPYSSLYNLQLY